MRTTARAIVVNGDKLLVMYRNKFGHEYYSLVGGGVDVGETPEQTLYREVTEETSLAISNHRLVIIENAGSMYGMQYIFLCNYVSGEPVLSEGSMEEKINANGKNLFKPMWLPITDLPNTKLLPSELKQALINGLTNGFPDQPLTLNIEM
jgi:ADP-ribose pyrophosphatase YjhB (NUDIX family)